MWKGDSDGGELPDRRQVAATQGPAAVTRRDPSFSTPPPSAFLRAEAPPTGPPACCCLPGESGWCRGDGVTGTGGCQEGRKRNTTRHKTEDKMSRHCVVFGL